jgi:beta-phosphoglucomutase-like phosphatase (HAD superfamily)
VEIHRLLRSEILSLNGKQSIYQMIRFQERVRERGGNCPAPQELLDEYQCRLDTVIAERSHKILTGQAKPDEFVVWGARAFLEKLRARGLRLIVLSGTVEHRVREEAELLGLSGFFGRHIYGANAGPEPFSKKLVIDRLLREEAISGRHLLSFGDGPVEIRETKAVGGVAIAVASNEEINGGPTSDLWKQEQLPQAGADGIVPDFREAGALITAIFGG